MDLYPWPTENEPKSRLCFRVNYGFHDCPWYSATFASVEAANKFRTKVRCDISFVETVMCRPSFVANMVDRS